MSLPRKVLVAMPSLPRFDVHKNCIQNPHVVILGAGASIVACPEGDRNGRVLPSLQNIQDVTDLRHLFDRIEKVEGPLGDGFEAMYSALVNLGRYQDEIEEINDHVRAYFASLQLPDSVTIYDLLLLGLREKDAIFTFNWDPFLLQAYRRCSGLAELPSVHFLHGCVDVAFCTTCKVKSNAGILCPRCDRKMEPSQLLYPVTDKDYESDAVIKGEWDAFRHYLSDAYFVTVFGYSAPVTDVAARSTMIEAFTDNRYRELSEVEVIDIRPHDDIEKSWEEFFFSHHYAVFESFSHSQINRHFRRSCDAFAMASLQCHPVPEHSPVELDSLSELRRFAKDLVEEENADARFWDGHENPFSG